ncbi:MAG TPA: hypothetical protein VEL51_09365 [Vicinamibacterales bacterium]|nr:hypothetical protein [Vicinamibacterales bacterium]
MAYEAKFVLLGFFSQNQTAGTLQDREQFGDDAFNRFDQHITDAARQAGLVLSDESRSIIAMMATMASGASPKTKAGQAVRAYVEYRGM